MCGWRSLRPGEEITDGSDKGKAEGIFHSNIFPGLWLKADDLLSEDLASVLIELQKGLASKEHGEFVAGLEKRNEPGKSEPSGTGDK